MSMAKHIFVVFLGAMVLSPGVADHWLTYKQTAKHCSYYYRTWKPERFYFCGEAKNHCYGLWVNGRDERYTYKDGQSVALAGGTVYTCCGTEFKEGSGYSDDGSEFKCTERSESGGTGCGSIPQAQWKGAGMYQKQKNPCGTTKYALKGGIGGCKVNQTLRPNNETTGTCVTKCTGGRIFASATSNSCVFCSQSRSQGPATDSSGYQYCLKCNNDQFFDKNTSTCKSKEDFTHYNKTAMAACWECSSNEDMELCLDKVKNVTSYLSREELLSYEVPDTCKGIYVKIQPDDGNDGNESGDGAKKKLTLEEVSGSKPEKLKEMERIIMDFDPSQSKVNVEQQALKLYNNMI